MVEKRKNKRLHVTINPDVYDAFMCYIDENGYDPSKVVEKMLRAYNRNRIGSEDGQINKSDSGDISTNC